MLKQEDMRSVVHVVTRGYESCYQGNENMNKFNISKQIKFTN